MARPIQDSVILFGDSLTSRQNVPGSLQARFSDVYRRTLDVLNRGYGGYTTTLAMPLFDQIFARTEEAAQRGTSKVRLVTIWFGTNDAVLPNKTGQHVPLEDYTSNLNQFLHLLTSSDSPYAVAHQDVPLNIILITPPPMYKPGMDAEGRGNRDEKVTKTYADAVLGIGKEWAAKSSEHWKVGAVDLWSGIETAANAGGPEALGEYFVDGLHFSTKGYDVLFDLITALIQKEFQGRGIDWNDLETLPMSAPDWSAVDPAKPITVIEGMKQGYRRT